MVIICPNKVNPNEGYIRLRRGVQKELKLTNWKGSVWLGKTGIVYDVIEEDGVEVKKQFTVISKRLLREMDPVLQKANQEGRTMIHVNIIRMGRGYDTRYSVLEFAQE